ncbi:MAG: hypothetical protein ACK4PI_11915 [Tepidisphaerales bacterium]
MAGLHLSEAERQILAELYARSGRTVDDLPYTQEFETLYGQFIAQSGRSLGRHEVWRALVAQRKAGRLVRKCRPG